MSTTRDFVAEFQARKAAEDAARRRQIEEATKPIDERIKARAVAAEEAEQKRASAQTQAEADRAAAVQDAARRQDLGAWLAAGGTAEEHAAAWPDRWRAILGERADATRRQAAQLTRNLWRG